ncbi:MAG: hypothetical protein R3B09_01495 [Nannocystaceae bacterium]
MRLLDLLGALALALVIGVLVVGHGVCLPLLDASGLLDPDLARAVSAPIAARLAEVLLAASIVVALGLPSARATASGRALAWALVGGAAVHRLLIVPAVADAWSRVDRGAMLPQDLAALATRWTQAQHWTLLGLGLVALALLVLRAALTPRPGEPVERDK